MLTTTNDSIIEKAVYAITKLQGHENWHIWSISMCIALGHTWEYVAGKKTSHPDATDSGYETWNEENCNALCRIWLTLDNDVKQAILPYVESDASQLFSTMKSLHEPQGTTAEFYTRHTYESVKLSDHDSFDGFMTTLINGAHQFNKEITDANGHIKNHDIAMRIIHALPTSLFTLQTILVESAPPSHKTNWDLQVLHQRITSTEECARAAGLKLGTKLNNVTNPKALTA